MFPNTGDLEHYIVPNGLCFLELVAWRCSVKRVLLKISQNSLKTPVLESLFKKSCMPEVCNFIKKEPLAQVFSCEFC